MGLEAVVRRVINATKGWLKGKIGLFKTQSNAWYVTQIGLISFVPQYDKGQLAFHAPRTSVMALIQFPD
ncbi:predicted protein [Coccidioides posadasii str. Silveira]|uniref:Predicted protein n=1 Tax=Coccidioides posadasii (strain RMSCC 757 / Silveira) TaxID=443226 RepID=E9DFC1_COCPS|nr:predicted protein [Coccidioides posadasii str. Silveira]